MSWHPYSRPAPPKIEIGSEYVTVREKHGDKLARILRDETDEQGTRRLTLDRLLDRHPRAYVEHDADRRQWTSSGVFVTVLTAQAEEAETDDDD